MVPLALVAMSSITRAGWVKTINVGTLAGGAAGLEKQPLGWAKNVCWLSGSLGAVDLVEDGSGLIVWIVDAMFCKKKKTPASESESPAAPGVSKCPC